MSTTRLLVLGAIKFMQPVHGYDVRRELLSWHMEDVTNIQPGSIYSALKTMHRDGLLAVHGTGSEGGRPARTAYTITPEGEKEFALMLRRAWWTVDRANEPLIPPLAMMSMMPRDELLAVLDSRAEQLRSMDKQYEFLMRSIHDGATGADGSIPEHVREVVYYLRAKGKAELEWTTEFRHRLRTGAYQLAGESDFGAPQI